MRRIFIFKLGELKNWFSEERKQRHEQRRFYRGRKLTIIFRPYWEQEPTSILKIQIETIFAKFYNFR